MHPSAMEFVTRVVSDHALSDAGRVLEVGSYNVNGSVRPLFKGDYHGVDIREGPGVDAIIFEPLIKWDLGSYKYDVVVSTEMLEHALRPWEAIEGMYNALNNGGWLILTCRGFDERGCYPVHDTRDVTRFTVIGLRDMIKAAGAWKHVEVIPDWGEPGVFATAIKGAIT